MFPVIILPGETLASKDVMRPNEIKKNTVIRFAMCAAALATQSHPSSDAPDLTLRDPAPHTDLDTPTKNV